MPLARLPITLYTNCLPRSLRSCNRLVVCGLHTHSVSEWLIPHTVSEAQRFALAQRPRLWLKWSSIHQHASSASTEIENRAYSLESTSLSQCLIIVEGICADVPKELVEIISTLVDQLCKLDIKKALRVMTYLRNVPRVHEFEDIKSLLPILVSILRDSANPHVRTAVTMSVADFISALSATKGWDLSAGEVPLPSLLDLLDAKMSSLRSSPHGFDADLRFCGNVMRVAYPNDPDDLRVHKILGCWTKQLNLAGDERSVSLNRDFL